MKNLILDILQDSIETKRRSIESNIPKIIEAADMLTDCLNQGHKVLIFGNGGSAADAQHLAAELVNRFQIERPPPGRSGLDNRFVHSNQHRQRLSF